MVFTKLSEISSFLSGCNKSKKDGNVEELDCKLYTIAEYCDSYRETSESDSITSDRDTDLDVEEDRSEISSRSNSNSTLGSLGAILGSGPLVLSAPLTEILEKRRLEKEERRRQQEEDHEIRVKHEQAKLKTLKLLEEKRAIKLARRAQHAAEMERIEQHDSPEEGPQCQEENLIRYYGNQVLVISIAKQQHGRAKY